MNTLRVYPGRFSKGRSMFERRKVTQRHPITSSNDRHGDNGTRDRRVIEALKVFALDRDLSLYSTRKLWNVVGLLEGPEVVLRTASRDFDLLNVTRAELRARGHAGAENPWKVPH